MKFGCKKMMRCRKINIKYRKIKLDRLCMMLKQMQMRGNCKFSVEKKCWKEVHKLRKRTAGKEKGKAQPTASRNYLSKN